MKKNAITFLSKSLTNKLILHLAFVLIVVIPLNKVIATTTFSESDTIKFPKERFSISFGGFLTNLKNDVIIGSRQVGLGITLNLEEALGLQSTSTALRSEAEYHFGKRGRSAARFGYFGYFRSAKKVLEAEIELEDKTFPIGTELNSKFDFQIIRGTYDYAFFMDERIRFGASIGLFVMPINFSTAILGEEQARAKFTAPLPVLGLSTDFALTPKIHFKQSVEILYLKFSNTTGILTDINLRIEYNPLDHYGFGLGLNSNNFNITSALKNNSIFDFVGSIETSFTGMLFYARYYL